jgi:hypothetical protein
MRLGKYPFVSGHGFIHVVKAVEKRNGYSRCQHCAYAVIPMDGKKRVPHFRPVLPEVGTLPNSTNS